MIYIFHFFVIATLFIWFGRSKETEKIFIYTSFAYVMFVFGQRWMTGTDFPSYLRYYISGFTGEELGYYGLQNFLRANDFYFGIIIFIVLFITQFNFYRFFLKFEKDASMMIGIFLISEMFLAQMSQLRQYVAISFFINSLYYAYSKRHSKSILNLILGSTFHSSILFLTPLLFIKFPFSKAKLSRKVLLIILLIIGLFPLINIQSVFALPIFGSYSNYINSSFAVSLGISHYIKFYFMLIVFIYYTFFMKSLEKTGKNILIINGILLYMTVYAFSLQFAILFRVAMFFQVFEIVFLVYYSNKLINLPSYTSRSIITLLFIGIFSLSSLVDSYYVRDYQFRPLRLYEDRTTEELLYETDTFYD